MTNNPITYVSLTFPEHRSPYVSIHRTKITTHGRNINYELAEKIADLARDSMDACTPIIIGAGNCLNHVTLDWVQRESKHA